MLGNNQLKVKFDTITNKPSFTVHPSSPDVTHFITKFDEVAKHRNLQLRKHTLSVEEG